MIHMQTKAVRRFVSLDDERSNTVAIGSDRDVALRKGFWSCFLIATQLCCKGHLEQDIRRKLRDLGIGQFQKKPFLEDTFGSEAKKELGLVDAVSRDEFDAVLESLYPVWTKRELEARQLTSEDRTEFYSYFLKYVAEDMQSMMIACVRKKTGFDDSFFYSNDQSQWATTLKPVWRKRSSVGLNAYGNSRKCQRHKKETSTRH